MKVELWAEGYAYFQILRIFPNCLPKSPSQSTPESPAWEGVASYLPRLTVTLLGGWDRAWLSPRIPTECGAILVNYLGAPSRQHPEALPLPVPATLVRVPNLAGTQKALVE